MLPGDRSCQLKRCVCPGKKAKPGQSHVCMSWPPPSTAEGTAFTGQLQPPLLSQGGGEARTHGGRGFAKQVLVRRS